MAVSLPRVVPPGGGDAGALRGRGEAGGAGQVEPPRVFIVASAQWQRALLRAELREVGYDAIGATSLATALRQPPAAAGRGPVRLFILDDDAAGAAAPDLLERARLQYPGTRFVLVRRRGGEPPAGPWDVVLRRPVTIGEIVGAVRDLVPLPPELRAPIDR